MTNSRFVSSTSATNPSVTVAIPTFNRATWLRDCVLSALAQSYSDFEVLVSDNASTDNTQDVLREFRDHPKVRIIRQSENIGLFPNFNACLAHANGQYIVFVSDDDRIAPWLLERCMALVKIEPTVPIVLALNQIYWQAEGRTLPATSSRTLATGIWAGPDVLNEYLRGNISVQICTILNRTDALRGVGGFPLDLPFSGDAAAWTQLLFSGKAGLVNEQCGTYTWHAASQTSRFPIHPLLENDRKLVDRIRHTADREIADARQRSDVKSNAQRYFARSAIWTITIYRRSGAKLSEVLPVVWRWRQDLTHIEPRHMFRLIRLIVVLLVPTSTINLVWRLTTKPVRKDSSIKLATQE